MSAPLTLKMVCKRTGLSEGRIYQLRKEGRFPPPINFEDFGIPALPHGANAWDAEVIERWIAEREARAALKYPLINDGDKRQTKALICREGAESLLSEVALEMLECRQAKGRLENPEMIDAFIDESKALLIACLTSKVVERKTGKLMAFEFPHGGQNSPMGKAREYLTNVYCFHGELDIVRRGVEGKGCSLYVQVAPIKYVSSILEKLGITPIYPKLEEPVMVASVENGAH
jgi:predicted DNA-binding transcriptional regulator AlpA